MLLAGSSFVLFPPRAFLHEAMKALPLRLAPVVVFCWCFDLIDLSCSIVSNEGISLGFSYVQCRISFLELCSC